MAVARLSRLCPRALAPHFVNTQFRHRALRVHITRCSLGLGLPLFCELVQAPPEKALAASSRLHCAVEAVGAVLAGSATRGENTACLPG